VDLDLVGFTNDDLSAVLDELDVDKYFEEDPTPKESGSDDMEDVADHEITCPHCGKVINLDEI